MTIGKLHSTQITSGSHLRADFHQRKQAKIEIQAVPGISGIQEDKHEDRYKDGDRAHLQTRKGEERKAKVGLRDRNMFSLSSAILVLELQTYSMMWSF